MKIKNKRVFVCSDHHFGQESFYRESKKYGHTLRPEFSSAEEADAEIIRRHNSIVPEFNSVVYFLGDIAKNVEALRKVSELHGEFKILVAGNHDCKFSQSALNLYFHQVLGAAYILNRKYLLTHIPVHPQELRDMVNLHGHSHREIINDRRYWNACLEVNNYSPIEL